MREYMPKVGTMGLDMMFRTCTVQVRFPSIPRTPVAWLTHVHHFYQVNLDFESEEDMVQKFRIGLALQVCARHQELLLQRSEEC
jgi:glutamate--cysteine ligase